METAIQAPVRTDGVLKRAFWLYGTQTIVTSAAYLAGYYLLPEGLMRGAPSMSIVEAAFAGANTFWQTMGVFLLYNMVMMGSLVVVANLIACVRGLSVGFLIPILLGMNAGLVSGTNSFLASDVTAYNAWEAQALNLSIGGLEMLAYVLVAAATANLGLAQYRSWWRSSGEWKPIRRSFCDLRLTRAEVLTLAIAVLLS